MVFGAKGNVVAHHRRDDLAIWILERNSGPHAAGHGRSSAVAIGQARKLQGA